MPEAIVGHKVRAFCNSLTALPSPVDEAQTQSGIIVPLSHHEESQNKIYRGVVTTKGLSPCESWDELKTGMVIYYRSFYEIADVHIVYHDDIIAYEEENYEG